MGNPTVQFTAAFLVTVAAVLLGFGVALQYAKRQKPEFPYERVMLSIGLWLLITGTLAGLGGLAFDTVPPTMLIVVFAGIGLTLWLASSRAGRALALSLPLGALVGFQVFRVPVELLLHRAYLEGLAPVQMTYEGLNFDIVSGITGGVLGAWLLIRKGAPRWLLIGWNALGLMLLVTIVTIALLSAPIPVRVFMEPPANTWVTQWPWIWLPTVFVPMALLFHILLFRRLRNEWVTPPGASEGGE